jgi:hypothetical protein
MPNLEVHCFVELFYSTNSIHFCLSALLDASSYFHQAEAAKNSSKRGLYSSGKRTTAD